MASTNKTTHYELSQYVGSDKPTYLGDYNTDMSKIDSAINTAQTTADTAGVAATTAQTAAEGAQTTANTAVTNAANAQTTANGAVSNIGDLTNLQTFNKNNLVTAINELILPAGSIIPYAGNTAPDGYILCDGSAVSRSTYSKLFTAIGTSYGSGDGSSTFNVPNLKGKVPVGYNSGETEFNSMGKTGGSKTVTLTTQQIPSHTHELTTSSGYGFDASIKGNDGGNTIVLAHLDGVTPESVANAGGGQSHENLQPYVTVNYIIKY